MRIGNRKACGQKQQQPQRQASQRQNIHTQPQQTVLLRTSLGAKEAITDEQPGRLIPVLLNM